MPYIGDLGNILRQELGVFQVKSSAVHISDPCYDRETWCAAWDIPALDGEWKATVVISDEGSWGKRVAELWAEHDDYIGAKWEKLEADIGVDSGQCGIYDAKPYPGGNTGEYGDKESFYGRVCSLTHPGYGGIIDGFGAVSSSGFGDGGYDAFVQPGPDGKATAVRVVFIVPEDEEE